MNRQPHLDNSFKPGDLVLRSVDHTGGPMTVVATRQGFGESMVHAAYPDPPGFKAYFMYHALRLAPKDHP